MCGITGIFNLNSEAVNQAVLTRMTRLLAHRGPDDEGVYISGNLGLGHRRLSIIDLSSRGHQPMSNEDANIWITFNGEIYNHQQLRKELIRKGHEYRSATDTETIIHLYEEEGIGCLEHLDGEFAFSIWDSKKKVLFCARDRLGVKPFYYHISDKNFIFASELKAILLHPEIRKEVDSQALWYYLSFSVTPAPLTMFKGIHKLEAGHFLLLDGNGTLKNQEYWDAAPKRKIECSQGEAIEIIRDKFSEAVRKRLMSDVPLGVFLSGGIDSSANVAFMSRMTGNPVKTFNVNIEGSNKYDESSFADLTSRYFNTEHRSIRIKFDDFKRTFEALSYYTDEPLCDYACIPNFYLAKLSRENKVPVIHVGEGNDELFCGYSGYASILNLLRFFYPLPTMIKGPALRLLELFQGENLHYAIKRAAINQDAFLGSSYLFTEEEKEGMFNKTIKRSFDSSYDYVCRIYGNLLAKFPQADCLDKMSYLDLKVRLPELLLMRADKMTMANSVEARLPFLDYKFVEYSLSLPAKFKCQGNKTKYIFKKSLKGILPDKIIFQPKKGFAGNPVNIFHDEFQDYVSQTYQRTEPLLSQWFDTQEIKKILSFKGRAMSFRSGMKTWSVFSLMLWLERHFK